jgi:hypothetical protein
MDKEEDQLNDPFTRMFALGLNIQIELFVRLLAAYF